MRLYTGINHLAMATADMDCTIRYWRDLLEKDKHIYPGEGKELIEDNKGFGSRRKSEPRGDEATQPSPPLPKLRSYKRP